MIKTEKFTPRNANGDVRLSMKISPLDWTRFKQLDNYRKYISVYDYVTKKNYQVRRAACGAGCMCDSVFKEI